MAMHVLWGIRLAVVGLFIVVCGAVVDVDSSEKR